MQKNIEARLNSLLPWLARGSGPFREALPFFFSRFSPQIEKSLEVALTWPAEEIGLIVGDSTSAFHKSVSDFLKKIGVPPAFLEKLKAVQALFPKVGLLFKADLPRQGTPSASLYYQHPLPLTAAAKIAQMLGMPRFPLGVFREIGFFLMKKGVYVGVDLSPDRPAAIALYYPQKRIRPQLLPGLLELMNRLKMGDVQKQRLASLHERLTPAAEGYLYISFVFNGKLLQLMKLDYEYLRLPATLAILKEMGRTEEELAFVSRAAKTLRLPALNYLGVKLLGADELRLKYYFVHATRKVFPENLEQIRWVSN